MGPAVDVISVDLLLWSFYFLCFKDVQNRFVYVVKRGSTNGDDEQFSDAAKHKTDAQAAPSRIIEEQYPAKLSERLNWIGTLLVSIRMKHWKVGDASHDRRQPPELAFRSRSAFMNLAIRSFVRGYLILDFTRAYISYDSYFTDANVSISSPLPSRTLDFVPPQVFRSAILAAQAWAAISQLMYLPCLLPLGLNALGWLPDEWSPHHWAPLFGPISVIAQRGVRGFWGEYWHQAMRIMSAGPGYAVVDVLGIAPGSFLRYAIVTSVAFFLSGVVHMGLVPPEPLHAKESVNMIRLKVGTFFWLQPTAILAEVAVGKLMLAVCPPSVRQTSLPMVGRKVVNVAFFLAWATFCLPLLGDMARQIGYWHVWPVPLSLWRGIRAEGWSTWIER
ncbi:uncharacterized protein LTR77_001257 [Saxophila tyrrhenica]|uniref:Wax synthase domain-containing protein n=1 Tax=Saxophila tyrrhenica TaxID=1690608 RepID=A0AAV9PPG1_9PEZI|nr:hypothetical protein LTR77_001257 [Saxophila tyrrhenica]